MDLNISSGQCAGGLLTAWCIEGQTFTTPSNPRYSLCKAKFYLRKVGSPDGNLKAYLLEEWRKRNRTLICGCCAIETGSSGYYNYILIKTNYRSPYTKEVNGFLIDVVHHSYFTEFMKKLNQDFLRMREVILQYHDQLVKEAEDTRRKYESERMEGANI